MPSRWKELSANWKEGWREKENDRKKKEKKRIQLTLKP
jgi:hypothetical protein